MREESWNKRNTNWALWCPRGHAIWLEENPEDSWRSTSQMGWQSRHRGWWNTNISNKVHCEVRTYRKNPTREKIHHSARTRIISFHKCPSAANGQSFDNYMERPLRWRQEQTSRICLAIYELYNIYLAVIGIRLFPGRTKENGDSLSDQSSRDEPS